MWKICSHVQPGDVVQLLTLTEAADYLRLKERKLYELVAEAAIPCTKVTGRWLFPKTDLDRWLSASLQRPEGLSPADPMPIIGGSHDPLLDWALRESGSGLATLPEGSEAGLRRFIAGELVAAAIHLHAVSGEEVDANVIAMGTRRNLHDAVLIGFSRREQGLVVPAENPLDLASLAQAVARGARMALRPAGAGAQQLLEALLSRAGLEMERLTAGPACPTGPDIAQAIRAGRADCGLATRAVANAAGLDFVPLAWERFDLVMRQRDYFRPPLQTFLAFLRGSALAARGAELGGYDLACAGEVRFAP
jgi:putative molybdopterin biosynthesis protein